MNLNGQPPKPDKPDKTHPLSVRSQRLSLVAAALLVSANLSFFGPFEIVTSNPAEFDVTFAQMVPRLIVLLLGLSALLSMAGFWASCRVRSRITSVLLAVGVLLWIQGSFLKWGYGEFDGKGIDWTVFSWQGWVDLGIWLLLIGAAFFFSDRLLRHVLFLALGFILIQSGLMVASRVTGSSSPALSQAGGRAPGGEKIVPPALCKVSSSRNVFHFILDGFQTDVFLELVEEDDLAGDLDGFTVYTENISTASQTVLSIPAIFSTKIYDGSVRQSEYFRSVLDSSFYHVLYKEDYVVNLMPHLKMPSRQGMAYFLCPRSYATPPQTRMRQAIMYSLDVSMFRQLPHFAKRAVFNDQNWRLSAIVDDPPSHVSFHQKAFFRDYMDRLEAVHTRPAYHFMHLMPPHGPFVTLADGSYAGEVLPNTRENYKNEARYALRLFIDFLDRLKDLGLYDSSIILMHGDHGMGLAARNATTEMQVQISSVTALMILKPPQVKGPLRVSKAQTMLTDIPATIMDLLNIRHTYPGEPVLKLSAGKMRDRQVGFIKDKSAKEPHLNRWVVRGSAADSVSWRQLQTKVVEYKIHPYTWGEQVRFGVEQGGEVYLGAGFTAAAARAWNDGESAEVVFGIGTPESDIMVRIAFFPYIIPGKVDRQRIRIWVNDFSLGEKVFTEGGGQGIQARIPRNALHGDRLVVRFEMPDAVAPRDIGAGRDTRKLAIALYSFAAIPVPNQ